MPESSEGREVTGKAKVYNVSRETRQLGWIVGVNVHIPGKGQSLRFASTGRTTCSLSTSSLKHRMTAQLKFWRVTNLH